MSIIGYNNNGWTVTTALMYKNGFGVALAQKVDQYVTWLYYINCNGGFNFVSGDYFTKEDSALESYRKKIDMVLA